MVLISPEQELDCHALLNENLIFIIEPVVTIQGSSFSFEGENCQTCKGERIFLWAICMTV